MSVVPADVMETHGYFDDGVVEKSLRVRRRQPHLFKCLVAVPVFATVELIDGFV